MKYNFEITKDGKDVLNINRELGTVKIIMTSLLILVWLSFFFIIPFISINDNIFRVLFSWFVKLWIVFWTIGGAIRVLTFMRQFYYREELHLCGNKIHYITYFILKSKKIYNLNDLKHLSLAIDESEDIKIFTKFFFYNVSSRINFLIGDKKVKFGYGLTLKQAQEVINVLDKKLASSLCDKTSTDLLSSD